MRGASTCASNGDANKAKPVAVMSRPLWLSGRRRQATSPQATNEAPTMRNATSMASNGTCRNRTGSSAPNAAAAASTHRTTHSAPERR